VPIQQITVLGAGTMGRGIAYLAALAEYEVIVYDVADKMLASAQTFVESTLAKGVEKGKLESTAAAGAKSRIRYMVDLEPASREANLIIEAVPESLELKKEILSQVDVYCPEDTVLASNTSSLSITEIAKSVERRERFIGMHFFNPPHRMKLVELVMGERTAELTVNTAREVAKRMGKESIVVHDSPGFVTSRLGVALGLEAIRMLEQGVATAEDIDRAMELGYNHPMGPLRLTDVVGLDVRLSIAEYLASTLGERFRPPELLRQMVGEGLLGKKSGRGFYEWKPE
jgi:3-hydroxybutyryl-CoA dehydrogenase